MIVAIVAGVLYRAVLELQARSRGREYDFGYATDEDAFKNLLRAIEGRA